MSWYKPLNYTIHDTDKYNTVTAFDLDEVSQLERDYIEAIKALIRIIRYQLFVEQSEHLQTYKEAKEICKKDIGIVEKLTGQKWEALKNMEDSDG